MRSVEAEEKEDTGREEDDVDSSGEDDGIA